MLRRIDISKIRIVTRIRPQHETQSLTSLTSASVSRPFMYLGTDSRSSADSAVTASPSWKGIPLLRALLILHNHPNRVAKSERRFTNSNKKLYCYSISLGQHGVFRESLLSALSNSCYTGWSLACYYPKCSIIRAFFLQKKYSIAILKQVSNFRTNLLLLPIAFALLTGGGDVGRRLSSGRLKIIIVYFISQLILLA